MYEKGKKTHPKVTHLFSWFGFSSEVIKTNLFVNRTSTSKKNIFSGGSGSISRTLFINEKKNNIHTPTHNPRTHKKSGFLRISEKTVPSFVFM